MWYFGWFIIICATNLTLFTSADRIISFPGQPQVDYQQFSGYIAVNEAGAGHGKTDRSLFYYFVEAQTDPSSKPLVLWLNGGPGCSSVGAGAFCEHGPFKPSGDVLIKNEYSWNKVANMLYLESPAGVGFSYSTNDSFYKGLNDTITARDNLIFLERWLEKFSEYKNRDFFLTGESYAGHYVPQLAQLILESKQKLNLNLKAIAIGNPLLEFDIDLNSRAEFFWSHGLISDSTYDQFTRVCNYSQIRRQIQLTRALTPVCKRVITLVQSELSSYVDKYDVTLDVCLSSSILSLQAATLDQLQDPQQVDVCVEDETMKYLNRADVQNAFHAKLVGVLNWTICSDVVDYQVNNLETPIAPVLSFLLKSGTRVLVYSGDQDSVIPLTGTRTIVNMLAKDLGLNTSVPYKAWFDGKQVAGWTQVYGDVLSFATIRGAAHEAPFTQPKRSLALFTTFLGGKPLPGSPLR
ncbi:serine carboxypeptidase-like 45 [Impatiens glandulifera]|uniref:serine carboxypeptidase-like 45 n=1 Tax=Impatiens glandulifera TaxID=253017 RepID=UPI001FB15B0F|nr:serine carboxypeptidase-like 45 [Impatiens glandulifera]